MAHSKRNHLPLSASLETQSISLPTSGSIDNRTDSSFGFVLVDPDLKPKYANEAAFQVLNYSSGLPPESAAWEVVVQSRLRVIFQSTRFSSDSAHIASFVSGRRRYICRSFVLDVRDADTRSALIAVLIERAARPPSSLLLEACRRFHLSPREYETVLQLMEGRTTKEIAERMNVSPNTVKQFVRLIMTKMNVTTRSGVLGKLLSA